MNDDDPLSDLERRLRAWQPADLPDELRSRLRTAFQPTPRASRWPRRVLVGALALATAAVLWSTRAFSPSTDPGHPAVAVRAERRPRVEAGPTFNPRWVLGESLTMNICTGVPLGNLPAAWRLDEDAAAGAGLLPMRAPDGKLPLKVDCQF